MQAQGMPHVPCMQALEVRVTIHDGARGLVPTVREDSLHLRAGSRVGMVPAPQKGSFPPQPMVAAWWMCPLPAAPHARYVVLQEHQ